MLQEKDFFTCIEHAESRALNEWCLFQLKALQLITQPHLEIAPIKCDDVCIHVFAFFRSRNYQL